MGNLSAIPTDYKKFLDQVLHYYLPSVKNAKTLFNTEVRDSGQVTLEYARQTQTYAAAKGWTSFDDPGILADGARPTADSIGTEDATSTPTRYGKSFKMDVSMLNSSLPIVQQYITQHTVEKVNIIDNFVNRTLISNMASNAAQSYTATGGTWATTGDPVADVVTAQTSFKLQSGGIDADFMLVHPNEYADLKKDQRFQSTLFTGKSIETGEITPKPFGLTILEDQAVTTGTFFMGKKGMFADLYVVENYLTFETDMGAAGKQYDITYKFVDQYKMPYYLMYGTGI